jgi:hypothetical protein
VFRELIVSRFYL